MAAIDVARALMQMDADGTWEQVAGGDRSPLGNLQLTDEEAELVRRAAETEAESDVIAFDVVLQERPNPMTQAATYGASMPLPPSVRQAFGSWLSARGMVIDGG